MFDALSKLAIIILKYNKYNKTVGSHIVIQNIILGYNSS